MSFLNAILYAGEPALEDLGEAMFDFGNTSDLQAWLEEHSLNSTDDI